MQCTYLLGLLLILGVNGGSPNGTIPRDDRANDFSAGHNETEIFSIRNFCLDPQQMVEAEKTLTIVYKQFFGSPSVKLSLRRNDNAKSGLASTISIVGDAISGEIKSVFKKFGVPLSSGAKSYSSKFDNSKSLKFSIYYQLMRMPLEIRPILREIQGQVKVYMQKNDYVKLGYEKMKYSLKTDGVNSTNEWESLATLEAINTYSTKFYNCLEQNGTRSFDIKKALGKLMNLRPETVRKILKRRLDRPLPKHPEIRKSEYNELHAFFCHAIAANTRTDYRYCLEEIKRVDKCVNAKFNYSSSENSDSLAGESSKNFIKTIKSLDESCVKVTGEMGFSIDCKRNDKTTKNNKFSYDVDFLEGDLKKSDLLNRMANELLSPAEGNRAGTGALREVTNLIGIYQNGMEKRDRLVKSAQKDVAQSYNGISENLADYRQHLAEISLKAIKHVNKVASNVENIFVDSTLKVSKDNLYANVRALKCFSDLMESICRDWYPRPQYPSRPANSKPGNNTNHFASHSKSSGSRDLIAVRNEIGFKKNSHDEPLEKMIDSMKRLSQTSPPRRSSALISLANTFLLATMFYECIAVLAAAIYREDSGLVSQSFSAENEDIDSWLPRDRRILTSTGYPHYPFTSTSRYEK